MASSADPERKAVPPTATARLEPELERELLQAVDDLQKGDFIELPPAALDLWADAGIVPWPEESPG